MLKYIKQKLVNKIDQDRMDIILAGEDFIPETNRKPQEIKTVTFAIARMLRFSGGYTSILRLGSQLANNGYTVYYAVMSNRQSLKEAEENAHINLKNYKGKIIKYADIDKIHTDVIIATYWRTVYETRKLNAYKMYFVQDYEPYFSQFGEQYLLARKTYNMGYHMVTLGAWNKHMIEHECGKNDGIDVVDFPFEPSEYKLVKRDFSDLKTKATYTIAAFIKTDQKRLPNIVNAILGNLVKEFEEHGKKLYVKFFGIDKSFKCSCGENLGQLTKQQMFELYKSADFGMSASMTNISLVPYEMLATGLPLIEFEEGTFPFFFPEGTAVLTDFSYKNLYRKLMNVIENPQIAEKMIEKAQRYLSKLSWENTGKQFAEILK